MKNSQIKELGKQTIKGNIFISFLVIALVGIISGLPSSLTSGAERAPILATIGSLIGLVVFIGTMPMQVGIRHYFVNLETTKKSIFSDVFAPYKNGSMEELIKAKLLVLVYTVIGLILFVIPGIYIALKYAMVDYVFAENPKASYKEAMEYSSDIMKGNKWRYIGFALSFILWWIACIFVFPIIYVAPYYAASELQFYYSIKKHDEPVSAVI